MLNQILQTLGHNPTATTQKHTIYKSPFNPSEKTPSFFVFPNNSGEWINFKDYSSGIGGDMYKFIMSYFNIGFKEAKAKVTELTSGEYAPTQATPIFKAPAISSFNQPKEKEYKIIKRARLTNKALIDYLLERGISREIGVKYLSEIYYQIENKRYFALCFYNDKAGMEIRNKYFKGSFGKKYISLVTPNPNDKRLKIFEGFMDFLSYLEINKNAPLSNYLILNSASMQQRGLEAVQGKFEAFELYLDNDNRGDEATQYFLDILSNITDKRVHYKEHKDLNDFLVSKNV